MRHPIIGLTLHYRHAALTERCVRSLLADGADAVLVWDNTGDEGESAKGITMCQERPDRVALEVSPANLGFAAGVNRGIAAILARWSQAWIFLLNNDAEVLPGAVSTLSEALAAHSSAVVAYPVIDQGDRFSGATYYQRHSGLLSPRPLPASVMHPSGCALMIAPERIELPLFDQDFFMYGEDVMLGARLGPQRMVHVPRVLVRHAGNAGSGQGSAFYEERMVAAHWLLARKLSRSRSEYFSNLLGRWLMLSARAAARSLRLHSLTPWRALRNGWNIARNPPS